MRPRSEAAFALGAVMVLIALAAAAGARGRSGTEQDPRASTFLSGPDGAQGLADGLRRMGVTVVSSRRLLPELRRDTTVVPRTLVALLNPAVGYSGAERQELLTWVEARKGRDLLLAGPMTASFMRCFGFVPERRPHGSVELDQTGVRAWPAMSTVLGTSREVIVVDSSRQADATVTRCVVPPVARVDTLLTTRTGRVVAVRLWRDDLDQRILLVADDLLLRNRALRETPAGPFALGLFVGRYDRVIFDEEHQGFGQGGSLLGAMLDWSARSPWGWAVWQLLVVGLLALLAGAVRFGPVRQVLVRRRRSPLEHVRALATALAAARGHDVAIGAIVQGLHRRLHLGARRGRVEWRTWVDRLAGQLRSPRAQDAARTLQSLTRPGQPPEGVLRAANAVEDVWQELRP